MGRKRRVECPHCKKINEVDIDAELEKQGTVVRRAKASRSAYSPKYIVVTCENSDCGQPIKIKVDID